MIRVTRMDSNVGGLGSYSYFLVLVRCWSQSALSRQTLLLTSKPNKPNGETENNPIPIQKIKTLLNEKKDDIFMCRKRVGTKTLIKESGRVEKNWWGGGVRLLVLFIALWWCWCWCWWLELGLNLFGTSCVWVKTLTGSLLFHYILYSFFVCKYCYFTFFFL